MTESTAWDQLQPVMMAMGLDPCRVENVVADGFPDVSYTQGLIELKNVDAWPSRDKTPVDLGLRKDQGVFLARRWRAGGPCWVMARVAGEWLLFDGWTAHKLRAMPNKAEVLELCALRMATGHQLARLEKWLRADVDEMMPHDRARFHRLLCCKSLSELSTDIGWPVIAIREAEEGNERTDDLLAVWEN